MVVIFFNIIIIITQLVHETIVKMRQIKAMSFEKFLRGEKDIRKEWVYKGKVMNGHKYMLMTTYKRREMCWKHITSVREY